MEQYDFAARVPTKQEVIKTAVQQCFDYGLRKPLIIMINPKNSDCKYEENGIIFKESNFIKEDQFSVSEFKADKNPEALIEI